MSFSKTRSCSISYSYKGRFCSNFESIFVKTYLRKSRPVLLGILYRPPSKSEFVRHTHNVFTETGVLDKQQCYLLGDSNINLLFGKKKKLSATKVNRINGQNLPPLKNVYLDICFSFSLEHFFSIPNRVTSNNATLIDHVLTNSSQKISKSSVVELGIHHDLVCCTRKAPSPELNKYI